jgi:hypothetical protein
LTKLPLPEATLSLRTLKPSPKVVDEEAVPDELCKFVRKPDMEKIKEAVDAHPELPPGVIMSNGGASLTVRRK